MTDRNEALRLADRISPETDWYEFDQVTWRNEAAALLRQQAERIAELEVARAIDTFVHNVMAGRAQLQMVRLESRLQSVEAERDQLKTDLHIATDDAAQMLASTQSLRTARDQLRAEVERLRVDAERWYTSFEHVSRILSGIHALMYPEPFTLSDGRTVVFRPKDPGPHEILQALSDRIRAIPDEVAAIDHARTTHKDEG